MSLNYIPRNVYNPVRIDFETNTLRCLHKILKKEHGVTFQHLPVGSGKTKLVTGTEQSGFDLDYVLIFHKRCIDAFEGARLKRVVMDILGKMLKECDNLHIDDSTSVITIRVTNPDKSSRLYGFDLALGYEDEYGLYIQKHDKHQERCSYELVRDSGAIECKAKCLHHMNMWNDLRTEYLKLKNDPRLSSLCSYQLYIMSVNNVYARFN